MSVGPHQYTLVELLQQVREELGLSERVMTIPSQLSGKVFDVVTRGLPKKYHRPGAGSDFDCR